jgi:hypothetical protein
MFAEGFFILVWQGHEMRDVREILDEVAAARARFGAPITYVAIQPEHAPEMAGDVRAARNRAVGELLVHCQHVHLVLEGEHPAVVHARRSALAVLDAMNLRHRVFVHRTVVDVIDAVAADQRPRAETAFRLARSRGVLPA